MATAKAKPVTVTKLPNINRYKSLIAGGFILLFAVGGTYLYLVSHAATPPSSLHVVLSGAEVAKANNPKVTIVKDRVNSTTSAVDVVQLVAGQQANFNSKKGYPDPGYVIAQTCYEVRAADKLVTADFVSATTVQTVSIPKGYIYTRFCIPVNSASKTAGYSIKNVTGGALNVYQVSYEYKSNDTSSSSSASGTSQ